MRNKCRRRSYVRKCVLIISSALPRQVALRYAGVVLVATKNDGNPTKGAVAFRQVGDVASLLSDPLYSNSKVRNFHRYAQVDIVGSYDTVDHAEAGLPEAERLLRLNPGPDVNLAEPLGAERQRRIVYALFLRLGPILTHWDLESRSVINETTPKHEMRAGFVVRQVARVDRNVYVTTFGEGVNTTDVRAYANGTLGPMPFFGMDVAVNKGLAKTTGFLSSALPGVSGSASAYPYQPTPFDMVLP